MDDKAKTMDRRKFLGGAAVTAAGLTIIPQKNIAGSSKNAIPLFNVLDYGIAGDGAIISTKPLQALIDKTSQDGGGILFFPPGEFITGTFQIKSNVEIHVSAGATIWGSRNREDYHHGCMVYAEDARNISITGMGTINGNGKAFWGQFMNKKISEEEMRQKMWRPGNMMQFVRCNKMLIEDVTIANSPAWTIRPIDCENVVIRGISILNGVYGDDGPNTDGINPDGCSKVRISDCYLECGDDCIVLKITELSKTKVCRDIVVTNCVMQTTETGLKIGTETHGEFRNITFSNCTVHDSGGGFGLLIRDGGLIDGLTVTNITVDCNKIKNGQGIFIWSHRRTDTTPYGMIKNVLISDMTITGGGAVFIQGVDEKHIKGLTLSNIRINVTGGRNTKNHDDPPYPFTVFGHRVSPYDIYCRYVDDLKLRNIQIIWPESEDAKLGSALRCRDINDLEIDGFVGRQSLLSDEAAIVLRNVNGVYVKNCKAPDGTGTVLHLDEGTKDVTVMANEFSKAKKLYTLGVGVDTKEIFESGNRLPEI